MRLKWFCLKLYMESPLMNVGRMSPPQIHGFRITHSPVRLDIMGKAFKLLCTHFDYLPNYVMLP